MRINELIVENQQIDELSLSGALGSAAKGAANIVGGVKGAWAGAKDVYNQQSGRVANVAQRNVQRAGGYKKPAASPATKSTAAPASLPQTGQGAGASADPASLRQQADALNQQADQLEKAATQTAPAAPTSTAATPTTPAPTTTAAPAQWPAGVPKFNSVTGQKFASPEEAEQVTNSPEFKQQMADIAAGKDSGDAQATQQQSPPTTPPPAPATTAAPASTPAAATTPPAGGKLTQAQQDAMKAKLQGQRAAGKTTASQTGAGFKDYVGGSGERMTGVDASGAPVFQKIQRESAGFRSKFLDMII